jgi:hypothetical protein
MTKLYHRAAMTIILEPGSWDEPVRWGRYLFPRSVTATVGYLPNGLVDLEVAIVDGRPACVGIWKHADGPPLSGEFLRQVPIGRIVREIASRVAQEGDLTPGRLRTRQEARRLASKAYHPQRGRRLSDEHLEDVADVYRIAYNENRWPTETVMQKFGTSRATAGRWVAEARRRRFLPPTNERQALA